MIKKYIFNNFNDKLICYVLRDSLTAFLFVIFFEEDRRRNVSPRKRLWIPEMRVGSDMMIESEIRGEKGPVDARMNARERPR